MRCEGKWGTRKRAGGARGHRGRHRVSATDDARHSIGQLMHVNGGDYLA